MFGIIHLVLNTSLKWIISLSIYLIVCIDAWIVFCRDVPIKFDYGILSELDWKYQVLLNLIIGLSASRWLVTPNDILNLINRIEGVIWLDCVFVAMSLKEIWYLTLISSKFEKVKKWLILVGIELKIKFDIWIKFS